MQDKIKVLKDHLLNKRDQGFLSEEEHRMWDDLLEELSCVQQDPKLKGQLDRYRKNQRFLVLSAETAREHKEALKDFVASYPEYSKASVKDGQVVFASSGTPV